MNNYCINLIDDLPKVNYFMLPSTFVSLLSSSECVSRGSGSGGGTVGELAPSLLTVPWRKELLILAGDVETNPGLYTDYDRKDLCMVLMHIYTNI